MPMLVMPMLTSSRPGVPLLDFHQLFGDAIRRADEILAGGNGFLDRRHLETLGNRAAESIEGAQLLLAQSGDEAQTGRTS